MSSKVNTTIRTCARCLRSTEAFLRAQISLLRPQGKSAEVGIAIRKLKSCIKVLKGSEADEPVLRKCTVEPEKDTGFPYLIGIVAQAAMTELFGRGMLTNEDVRYLRSDQAQRDFVCRKVEFLRPYLKGDKAERLDKSGRDRYYFPAPLLGWRGEKYYLTKELTKEKLPNLLRWIYAHGLNRSELIEVCKKYVGVRDGRRSGKTLSPSSDCQAACPIMTGAVLQKAVKPGKYVNNFFRWISGSAVKLPADFIAKGMSLHWSVSNLDLWRPLFATEKTLTQADRDGHRFWKQPFNFGGELLYVNSQWYGNERGSKQKAGFDKLAVEIANACGLQFSPYPLPGIPELDEPDATHPRYSESRTVAKRCADSEDGGITICITSSKKKTFRFKG